MVTGLAGSIPTPASAAVSCTFSDGVVSVSVTSPESELLFHVVSDTIVIEQPAGRIPCEDPTLTPPHPTVISTETIRVTGSSPSVNVFIDLTGGPFAPGFTPEPDESSEIEFDLDFQASPDDRLPRDADGVIIAGTSGPDLITSTATSSAPPEQLININTAETVHDQDVRIVGGEGLAVFAGGGNDRLTGSGGFDIQIFSGGDGNDELRGEGGFDVLRGEAGNDVLLGGSGNDVLIGGRGRDRCEAGPGKEEVKTCEFRVVEVSGRRT